MALVNRNLPKRKNAAAAEWADLPPELLQLIASKLADIFDGLRFRSVCRTWRSSVDSKDLHPRIPWLILPGHNVISFFNPSNRRVYNLDLPEAQGKYLYGSLHGWLVMIERQKYAVTLLNPITRAQIRLPPFGPFPNTDFPPGPNSKVLLCSNPLQEIVVVIWSREKLFFYRNGDSNWGEIGAHCCSIFGRMVYFEKKVYVVDGQGRLSVIDITTLIMHPLLTETLEIRKTFLALVEATGSLLLCGMDSNCQIDLFRLDRSTGELKWSRASNGIGTNILYMTFPSQCQFVLGAKASAGIGNCIYLFDGHSICIIKPGKGIVKKIKVCNIRTERLSRDVWMIPSLQ